MLAPERLRAALWATTYASGLATFAPTTRTYASTQRDPDDGVGHAGTPAFRIASTTSITPIQTVAPTTQTRSMVSPNASS